MKFGVDNLLFLFFNKIGTKKKTKKREISFGGGGLTRDFNPRCYSVKEHFSYQLNQINLTLVHVIPNTLENSALFFLPLNRTFVSFTLYFVAFS